MWIMVNKSIKKFWITNKFMGECKRYILKKLQTKYNVNDWHASPINDRPYGIDTVLQVQSYLDMRPCKTIVEVGCGVGSIIGNLCLPPKGAPKFIGYDINSNNLKLGKLLHPKVKFIKGSFDKVNVGEIDCLIMVGFIYLIPYDELKKDINRLLSKNNVRLFVFDTFSRTADDAYCYSHKGEYLLGGNYKLVKKSKGFKAAHHTRRYVEYWEKV